MDMSDIRSLQRTLCTFSGIPPYFAGGFRESGPQQTKKGVPWNAN